MRKMRGARARHVPARSSPVLAASRQRTVSDFADSAIADAPALGTLEPGVSRTPATRSHAASPRFTTNTGAGLRATDGNAMRDSDPKTTVKKKEAPADSVDTLPPEPLLRRAGRLPRLPGVYLMKDARGKVIYVGKATNLRARVRSYFSGNDERAQVAYLLAEVADIDFTLASSPREALILEDVLIKKFRPRYNIRLRDDKTYLSIRMDLRAPFPKIELMRRPRDDGARYFGPYTSAASARQTVGFIKRHFPLRSCEDSEFQRRRRPCLEHQIGRCLAPCVGRVSSEDYRAIVDQVVLVLEGKNKTLRRMLEARMRAEAEALAFEQAAILRDRILALDLVTARQEAVVQSRVDGDAVGWVREADDVAIAVVPVRQGRMQDSRSFVFSGVVADDDEVMTSFLVQHYREQGEIPSEISVLERFEQMTTVAEVLAERAGRRVVLSAPVRGRKRRMVDLAMQTAAAVLAQERDQGYRAVQAARELQRILKLPELPRSLECFDISNISGKRPVGSKVRFLDGKPDKSGYRHYRIKHLEEEPNDYAMMEEVLTRRIRRGLEDDDLPDILVVDGGKGHLNVARRVLAALDVPSQPVVSLAKPRDGWTTPAPFRVDKLFLPERKNPVRLPHHSPALRLLQALRDESHRFAVSYHRKLRRKNVTRTSLDEIPGVGRTRQARLLKAFGSVKRLATATEAEIAAVPGIGPALAATIVASLAGREPPGTGRT